MRFINVLLTYLFTYLPDNGGKRRVEERREKKVRGGRGNGMKGKGRGRGLSSVPTVPNLRLHHMGTPISRLSIALVITIKHLITERT